MEDTINTSSDINDYFNNVQIDGAIIKSHSSINPDINLIQLSDGRVLIREEKLNLINIDLTSSFMTKEMQEYCLNAIDYLNILIDLETELGINLTRHYNKIAKTVLYLYPLSKSGGKAAGIVKSHHQVTSSYSLDGQKEDSSGGEAYNFVSKILSGSGKSNQMATHNSKPIPIM